MYRLFRFGIVLILLVLGINQDLQSSVTGIIYFYNPETNINNYTSLKTEFESYFAKHGNYQFQPFNESKIFESVINDNKNSLFILSNWHLMALKKQSVLLEVALLGTLKGESMQRKVLSTKNSLNHLDHFVKGMTIAGAGNEDYIRSVLKQIFGTKREPLLEGIKILTVPKDIDALLAVGFGMAAAALTAESSLEKLDQVNPNQFRQLHSLGFSEKDYRLVVATFNKAEENERKIIATLQDMQNQPDGKDILKMLGIDGWETVGSNK